MINQYKEQYYKQRILNLMTQIENKTKKMFHETYPDLEQRIWLVMDNDNDKAGLVYITNQLNKILEEV